ncbi:MAG: alpha/beta hydrolase, partial [Desulfobulbaceae bacterium]|nr:alpha/beta hydrolase [Desulfobulbaceae bacterium]
MDTKTVTINGLRISYQEQGSGRPVVFVHGNSCSGKDFSKQMQSDLAANYRLIVPDLPGHGESDWARPVTEKDYWVSYLTDFLVEFCRRLDCEDAVLVGYSYGGNLVLETIPLLPALRGAVIFGAPPLGQPPRMEEAFLPDPVVEVFFAANVTDDDITRRNRAIFSDGVPIPDHCDEDFKRTDPRVRGNLGPCVLSGGLLDEVEIVKKLQFPLAIVHGE